MNTVVRCFKIFFTQTSWITQKCTVSTWFVKWEASWFTIYSVLTSIVDELDQCQGVSPLWSNRSRLQWFLEYRVDPISASASTSRKLVEYQKINLMSDSLLRMEYQRVSDSLSVPENCNQSRLRQRFVEYRLDQRFCSQAMLIASVTIRWVSNNNRTTNDLSQDCCWVSKNKIVTDSLSIDLASNSLSINRISEVGASIVVVC